jgi:hypothetical protein
LSDLHPFEARGLGKAPFKFVGLAHQEIAYGERVLGHVGGCTMTTKPGGTCAYCGTYITNMYNIESADGVKFHVGSECVKKTDDAKLVREAGYATRKMNRERRVARGRQAKADAKVYCDDVLLNKLGTLCKLPHPHPFRAEQGETLADWARFMDGNRLYEAMARQFRKFPELNS